MSLGLIIAFIVAAIPFIDQFKASIVSSGIIKDEFALAALQANGSWSLWECTISILLVFGLFHFLLCSRKNPKVVYRLYASTIAFVLLVIIFYTPKIEKYSQGAEIEFCEKLAGKQVYLETLEFRSYAIYYYFDKPKPMYSDNQALMLLTGKLDKDAYFIVKNTSKNEYLKNYPELKYLYERNGFVFLQRKKSQ